MTKRTACLVAFAAAHLTLVVLWDAANIPLLPEGSAPEKVLHWYGRMSGTDSGYGFFAPNVAEEARAVLTITDDAGRSWTEPVVEGDNEEVRARLSSMYGRAAGGQMRRGLARSWAARAFARYPAAQVVTVNLRSYDTPTMDEFRDGETFEWVTIYERSFRRGEDLDSEKGGDE